MVSSLIGPQYHQDQFWTFSESAAEGQANEFDVPVVPAFNDDFEVDTELNETVSKHLLSQYAHFHGTEDMTIPYEGQNPGPPFLNHAEVLAAQLTDFLWAGAMGHEGEQLGDSEGVSVGSEDKPTFEYLYLGGRVRHYKLVSKCHNHHKTFGNSYVFLS